MAPATAISSPSKEQRRPPQIPSLARRVRFSTVSDEHRASVPRQVHCSPALPPDVASLGCGRDGNACSAGRGQGKGISQNDGLPIHCPATGTSAGKRRCPVRAAPVGRVWRPRRHLLPAAPSGNGR
jgi:hypothetical protein